MRPTRRGLFALGIAAAAVILAGAHGPRALNAVAAPLFGAVALGAVQVWRADEPTVEPRPVEPGFPGAERTYRVEVDAGGVLEVRLTWPAGLEGDGIHTLVAGSETVETAVTLGRRGRYRIDAPTVHQRDALGLVRTTRDTDRTTTILVYPEIRRDASPDALGGILGDGVPAERGEFASLREYVPGDPLRDVHWKSSAKGADFVVAEYEPSDRTETLTIAATAEPGAADAMATAAGTVAVLALESGLAVGLALPGTRLPPGSGRDHESALLSALAGATHGSVDDADADVGIHATGAETRITIGDATHRFEDVVERPIAAATSEVSRA